MTDEPFGTNDTGNDYSAQAVVKNSAEMQDQNTYLNWDFTTVWSIDSDINSGYPYLPPIFYTVTFDSNGGSMIDSLSVRKNTTTAEPAAPTRAGYSFGGWYSDEDITTAFDFDTPINSDITLYAKWTPDSSDPADCNIGVRFTGNSRGYQNHRLNLRHQVSGKSGRGYQIC